MEERQRTGSPSLGGLVLDRQLRSAPGLVVLIFLATLVTSAFITATPRVLERVAEEDLLETLVEAAPEQRNIRAETLNRLDAGPGEMPMANAAGERDRLLAEDFPEAVRQVIGDTGYVVESPSFRVTSFPGDEAGPFPTTFRFRFQEDIEEKATLVSGSLPGPAAAIPMLVGGDCPADRFAVEGFQPGNGMDCEVGQVAVLETAVTAETAAALEVDSGDSFLVRPEGRERLWYTHGVPDETQTWVVTVSGIVELDEPESEFWYADTALHRPRIVESPDFRLVFVQGLMPADLYDDLLATVPTASFEYTWRYFVDPDRVEADRAQDLIAGVPEIAPAVDGDLITSLPRLLESHLEQRATTITLVSVVASSLLLVALAVILVFADVYAGRRARDIVLVRDRGASTGQLTLTSTYTGLVLVAPAALLGYTMTAWTLGGTGSLVPGRGAGLLVLGGVMVVVAAMTPHARRRQLTASRSGRRDVGAATRRLVVDVFVTAMAVGSIALLRRRGLADSRGEGLDILLAITPALAGVAVGLLALRLLAPLSRLLEWLGRNRQTLVRHIGLRGLGSPSAGSRTPLVVIAAAVTLAVLSATVRTSIANGQATHSWQVVGGDVRVEGRDPGSAPAVDLAGQDVLAEGAMFPNTLVIGQGGEPRLTVLAIDVPAYRDLVAAAPNHDEILATLDALESPPATGPAPAVVSTAWGNDPPTPGSLMSLDLGAVDPSLTIAAVVDRFPALDPARPFAVISLEMLRSMRGELGLPATVYFLRATERDVAGISEVIEEMDPQARVISRYVVAADTVGDPFVKWADRGLAAGFYLSTVFAVMASLAFFVAVTWNRKADLGLLRILGLTTRQTTAISIIEVGIPVAMAIVLGGLAGAAVPVLLSPRIDIAPFTGGSVPGPLVVDWVSLAMVVGVIALVTATALAVFVAMTRQAGPITSLSLGDD